MIRTKNVLASATAAVAAIGAIAASPGIAAADGMPHTATHVAPKDMTVKTRVVADAMKGYNLFVRTTGFRWAPEHASGKHRQGEGHAHLYIDGVKLTRLYGRAYYLAELTPGRHVIRVSLNGNDHGEYVRAGHDMAAEAVVTVPTPPM